MPEYIEICEESAKAGGAVLQHWRGKFAVREKGPADLVTQADLAAQDVIREVVLSAFPEHDFLGEENTSDESASSNNNENRSPFRWICDPLDGTTNYVHGVPCYSVSVALEHEGEIVAGAIFDPNRGECFSAAKAKGAFLDGMPMETSAVTRLDGALIAAGFGTQVTAESLEVAQFLAVLPRCQAVRRIGSAALNLANVACGRYDAYWVAAKSWDVAAGVLLVEEAGGIVTGQDGEKLDINAPRLVAGATAPLHQELLEVVKAAARSV
jgi:myo-inositol-1(or 4)-monophosphatase